MRTFSNEIQTIRRMDNKRWTILYVAKRIKKILVNLYLAAIQGKTRTGVINWRFFLIAYVLFFTEQKLTFIRFIQSQMKKKYIYFFF